MLIRFFYMLREGGVPVSLTEFLVLLEALEARVIGLSAEEFYWLARTALVKDERWYDRFDRVFAAHFKGLEQSFEALLAEVPGEWLRRSSALFLSEEDKARIQALGGWDKLMETLRQRLEEQKGRHQGGSKWIGTGGTSPFGADGYNPEGVRIGQDRSRNRRAVKVWDRREFANLDDSVELGTRNIKLALRRLRRFARQGNSTRRCSLRVSPLWTTRLPKTNGARAWPNEPKLSRPTATRFRSRRWSASCGCVGSRC